MVEVGSTVLPFRHYGGTTSTQGKTKETWMHLCEQAAIEQDPDKLLALVNEINRLLKEKENRLHREQEQQRR
jgi:hypothetical protein